MFDNSFSFWLFNLGVTAVWLTVSVVSGNYFMAIGAVFYLAFSMLVELPGTSSEPGSNEDSDDPDDGLSSILR